jgi:hypothetical protein
VEKELSENELLSLEHDLRARQEGEKIVKELDQAVNSMDDHAFAEGFVEQLTRRTHRTLQQNIARLFLKCFAAWAEIADKGEGHYDLRNEGTVKLAQKIRDLKEGLPFV